LEILFFCICDEQRILTTFAYISETSVVMENYIQVIHLTH
jgi:hypothetical protein